MDQINKCLLELVKDGRMKKDMAFQVLKRLNMKEERESDDIAIIGIACKYPEAENHDEYWENLKSGRNSIGAMSENRKEDAYVISNEMTDFLEENDPERGYLKEIDKFDAAFFRLSPKEASLMDPYQRIFLETAYEAIEDAGYGGNRIWGTRTGVYAGVDQTFKSEYGKMANEADLLVMTGSWTGILASRISYILNLTGPSMVVDTACSSGLVALHLACMAIRNGECSMAVAGGINIFLHSNIQGNVSLKSIESPDGMVRAFDKDAKGTVWGEGVGVVLVKALSKAIEDRDHIYAVIKGSAINNDGASNGITAPSVEQQENVLVGAWTAARVNPETLAYIETHGTGTLLGDPIEVKALVNAFEKYTNKKQFCGIGSVKNNIGHTIGASGIASLLKVVLAMKNEQIPSTINYKEPNPYINFEKSPVFVNSKLREWKRDDLPRRAGVSAFGFSGTNCHMVIEEAPSVINEVGNRINIPFFITLSAKSKNVLEKLVNRYHTYMGKNRINNLGDLCYTANTGRGHYKYRIAIIFRDEEDLKVKLEGLMEKKITSSEISDGIYFNEHKVVPNNKKNLEKFEITEDEKKKLNQNIDCKIKKYAGSMNNVGEILPDICDAYIKGAAIDWEIIYKDSEYRKISVPVYPLERKRYWINTQDNAKAAPESEYYSVFWQEEKLVQDRNYNNNQTVLILKDKRVSNEIVKKYKEKGIDVIEVVIGDSFGKNSDNSLSICGTEDDYEKIAKLVKDNGVNQILHLMSITDSNEIETIEELNNSQKMGIYSLYDLTRSILQCGIKKDIELVVISEYVNKVSGREQRINPENATLFGLGMVITQEYPNIKCRCIDIDHSTNSDSIFLELEYGQDEQQVALREGRRFIKSFKSYDIEKEDNVEIEFKEKGVYVITGGLGAIGLETAKYLASRNNVKLALLNRTNIPEKDKWDDLVLNSDNDKLREKIKSLIEIEAMGAEVVCPSVDVSKLEDVGLVLNELRKKYGKINGIIHAAGIYEPGFIIRKNKQDFINGLTSKVDGAWILNQATINDNLDFFVMYSSAAAIFAKPGLGDYCSANCYLDSFAYYRNKQGKKTLSINWPTWKGKGMGLKVGDDNNGIFDSLSPEEGIKALNVVLNKNISNVLIAKIKPDYKNKLLEVNGNIQQYINGNKKELKEIVPQLRDYMKENIVFDSQGIEELKKYTRLILLRTFQRIGILKRKGEQYNKAELKEKLGIIDEYKKLFNALLDIIQDSGFIEIKNEEIMATWKVQAEKTISDLESLEERKQRIIANYPGVSSQLFKLIDTCMDHYKDILSGSIPATHIIFPNSSMELIGDIYKHDHFNELAGQFIKMFIEKKNKQSKDGKCIRILEVGAGTGGASASVFKKLESYGDLLEYYYTDISKGFTDYGSEVFGREHSFVKFKLLDIEKDVELQGYKEGSFDIVLASNVIHATSNIENALKQVVKLLSHNGVLVLNELTKVQDFATLTFGLLGGWWLYEDEYLRIKDSPLVGVAGWRKLLTQNGFSHIHVIGDLKHAEDECMQALIVAECQDIRKLGIVKDRGKGKLAGREDIKKSVTNVRILGRKDKNYSKTERQLAQIWSEVLGFESINIFDNFYELGGDSILATKILTRINMYIKEVGIIEMMKYLTIIDLGAYLDEGYSDLTMTGKVSEMYSSIESLENRDYYPLSSAQIRMFFLGMLEGVGTAYNVPITLIIEGDLDKNKLEAAFKILMERHESFRTAFEIIDGEPVQRICDDIDFHIKYLECTEDKIQETVSEFIKPFDLSKAPLLRVGLAKMAYDRHLLIIDMHHIIVDGTSINKLFEESISLYAGIQLPEMRIQYRDFVVWQKELFDTGIISKQEEYWLNRLSGEIPVLKLPLDYPRTAVRNFEGDMLSFETDKELTSGLINLASEMNATPYMVLLAVYNILLAKITNQDDVIVGSPIEGRHHKDLESVVGMFVNILVMRNFPEKNKTFAEFLEEVKVNSLEAYENQHYQFEELVENLTIERDLGRNPLFDTMFALLDKNLEEAEIDGLKFIPIEFGNKSTRFDITLSAIRVDDKIKFNLEYCSKLFRRDSMEKMVEYFINIAKIITNNRNLKIKDISVVAEAERQRIIYDFNDTIKEYPENKNICFLFEEQVDRTPEEIAIIFGEKALTYRELESSANRWAHYLREVIGVGSNSCVGIYMENSIEQVIAILGILKAGAAYVPISTEIPFERVKSIILDASISCILYSQKHFEKIEELKGACPKLQHYLCADRENLRTYDNSRLKITTQGSDSAYLIFTSGTTGRPKGVVIEHRGIYNAICWRREEYGLGVDDKVIQLFSYAFDGFLTSLFTPLVSGASIVLLREEETRNPIVIKDYLVSNKITHFITVPTLYSAILDNIETNEVTSLKVVTLAGEKASSGIIQKSIQKNASLEIVNEYGPTEYSVVATFTRDMKPGMEAVIGRPISNTQVYILDENNGIQPVGVPGELCISGAGLAREYLNWPDFTSEKFVQNPFDCSERMYKTGDLARWNISGNLEFLGRLDHQVKIRGFRIELAEIEACMLSFNEIKEAVVIDKEDSRGTISLCAYFVSNIKPTILELREHLAARLPDYMIPTHYIMVDQIPLTSNGKINKSMLPKPVSNINIGVDFNVAPENQIEEKIVEIWRQVLDLETVGVNNNFFDLGGNSMLLAQVFTQLKEEYSDKVSLTDLFLYPTIKKLASFLIDKDNCLGRKISIEMLSLPENYFCEKNSYSVGSTFDFQLKEELLRDIKILSNHEGFAVVDFLVAMCTYLFAEAIQHNEITIQTMIDDEDTVIPIKVNINDVDSVLELVYQVSEAKSHFKETASYKIQEARGLGFKKGRCDIAPLMYKKSLLREKIGLLNIYDFILEVNEKDGYFSCEYNCKKLRKEKVEKLINGYVNLLEIIVNNYKR